MLQQQVSAPEHTFLKGGGEMGELTAAYDWSATVLGPISAWPQNLRAAVSLMLKSRFPMLIFWGPELITFYNDAFRPSLGDDGKHPGSLGQRGELSWAESWPVIGPMIHSIMGGGNAVWFEDQKLPLYRDGQMGYAYWTYSFSPIEDGDGKVEGLLVTCAETTRAVEGLEKLKESNRQLESSLQENRALQEAQHRAHMLVEESQRRLLSLFDQSPVALATLVRDGLTFTSANNFYAELVGRSPEQIIGKTLMKALPEVAGQGFEELLINVFETGDAFVSPEVPVQLMRGGKMESFFVNLAYQPMPGEDGTVSAILVVATDITPQVAARQKIEASEARFQRLIRDAAVGIVLLTGDDLRVELVNEVYAHIVGHTTGELLHRPIFEVLPESEAYFRPFIEQVRATGEEVHLQNVPYEVRGTVAYYVDDPTNTPVTGHINVTYQPYREADGAITGIMVVVHDITAQTAAQMRVQDSEMRFRTLVEKAPTAISVYRGKGENVIELANDMMLGIWGKNASVVGKPLLEALPELVGQPFNEILDAIYDTGIPYSAAGMPAQLEIGGIIGTYYFNFTYQPLIDADEKVYAILNMALDVTEQVLARKAVDESETRLRALISSAPVAIGIFLGEELIVDMPNPAFVEIVGKGPHIAGRRLAEVMPELAGEGQPFLDILKDVYRNGNTFRADAAPVKILRGGKMTDNFFNVTFSPLRDSNGEIYAILDISVDVTDTVLAHKRVEDSEKALAAAIELAELATWDIDVRTGKIAYSERLQNWLGLQHATLDPGVSPSVHPRDAQRVRDAINKALETGGDGRFDEVYTIINAQTGAEKIIHSNGQVFYDSHGYAIRLAGTAQDITIQRDLQTALEQEVQTRTEELGAAVEELQATNEELGNSNDMLTHSNEELAQYAYVASHDLQEPLRKIQVFSGMMIRDAELSETSARLASKIGASANRMGILIRDLLEFSQLLKSDAMYRPTDLNAVARNVFSDFEIVATEKKAILNLDTLPTVEAVSLQMNQLFYNIIGNALKFTKPGVPPVISLTSRVVSAQEAGQHIRAIMPFAKYYEVCIQDNGIGFEKQYADQIFEVFKRLHGRDSYPGSGIGLALCRRIVTNHGGVLLTKSTVGKGSTFCVILPDKQTNESSTLPAGIRLLE